MVQENPNKEQIGDEIYYEIPTFEESLLSEIDTIEKKLISLRNKKEQLEKQKPSFSVQGGEEDEVSRGLIQEIDLAIKQQEEVLRKFKIDLLHLKPNQEGMQIAG